MTKLIYIKGRNKSLIIREKIIPIIKARQNKGSRSSIVFQLYSELRRVHMFKLFEAPVKVCEIIKARLIADISNIQIFIAKKFARITYSNLI